MYNISWEIIIDAENPLEAANIAQEWMREDDWQFYVQDDETKEIFSVDMNEEDSVLPIKEYTPIIECSKAGV